MRLPIRVLVLVLASLSALAPVAARAAVPEPLDCSFPEVPELADGATASADEMAAARTRVADYLARMRGSLFCLDMVRRRLFERGTPGQLTQIDALTNSGIAAMDALADRFAAEERAFPGGDPSPGRED
ncbi:MAG TPA: hypothetical protein VLA56_21715 [Pseudomonadales bacterium]|nr:hypothetical protein [Pseudomonadales bacterium]